MVSSAILPEWKRFENAVARFAAAMDPQADVRHNVRTPDPDTAKLRQRDVWINAKICGLFPVTVLVSCKRYRRKLHEGDIDAFIGELVSSRAHKGVIYSSSGFNAAAVEKARAHGICCCRLYSNQAADLPEVIGFPMYCCKSQLHIEFAGGAAQPGTPKNWGDVLELEIRSPAAPGVPLRSFLEEELASWQQQPREGLPQPTAFEPLRLELLCGREHTDAPYSVLVEARWVFFRARCEAYLVNGSYSMTSGEFTGEWIGPSIAQYEDHPGDGWSEVADVPGDVTHALLFLFGFGDVAGLLQNALSDSPFSRAAVAAAR